MMAGTHPFLEHPKPIALAHRGGGDPLAENTMSAFTHAVELGYQYIETDIHATSDGVVVTFHDDDLSKASDQAGRISRLTWRELKSIRVGGEFSIPRLDDVLTTWPHIRLNIDIKHQAAIQPLGKLIESAQAAERVCIASFSRRRLEAVRQVLRDGPCYSLDSLSAVQVWARSRLGSNAWRATRRFSGRVVQLPSLIFRYHLIDRRLVEFCAARGLEVHAWTVNSEAEMNRLIDVGVDGIITDRTELLKTVLQSRQLWQ